MSSRSPGRPAESRRKRLGRRRAGGSASVEGEQQQGRQTEGEEQEEARRVEREREESPRAEEQREEQGLVDRAVDEGRERGLIGERTADQTREKGLLDTIKDKLLGR